jgi:serine/threonine-protein kinase
MLSAAVVTFGLTSARRLLDKGFRQADLGAAFQAEQDSLKEERTASPRRALRVVERVLNRGVRVAASTVCVLLPFCVAGLVLPSLDAVPLLTSLVTIVTVLLTLGWLVSLQALRDVDVTFWRAVWTGDAGRLAFAAAKRLRGAAPTVAAMTHRATEMSLGLAAEQLYESLPKDVRQSLPDVPAVLEQLQQRAELMRARLAQVRATVADARPNEAPVDTLVHEEQRLAVRLREAVGAMERLRLNLLRLHAGSMSVESATMEIERVTEAADDVRRLTEARREVDDIFGAVHVTQDLRTPSNPEYA